MSDPTQQTHAKQTQTKHQQGVCVGGRISKDSKRLSLTSSLSEQNKIFPHPIAASPLPPPSPPCKQLLIFHFPSINLLSQTKPCHHPASHSFCMGEAFFQLNVNYVFGSDFHDERGRRKK
jgi:hypothetical protein